MNYLKLFILFFSIHFFSYSQQNICDSTLTKEKYKIIGKKTPPHFYYYHLPAIGECVSRLPNGAIMMASGSNYFYYNGIFYQPRNGRYIVVLAPKGIRINILPYEFIKLKIDNNNYYYFFGTFYTLCKDGSFIVTTPPIGAKVNALPYGYKIVKEDNIDCYLFNKTLYKEIITEGNKTKYLVIKNY